MALTKDQLITACQQLLAAAAVSTVALTAAGVATLDIVAPGAAGHRDGAGSTVTSLDARAGVTDEPAVHPRVTGMLTGDAALRGVEIFHVG